MMTVHDLKCSICQRTFSKKSSLVRHGKRCINGPRPSMRKRSCLQCAGMKVKCNLRRPKCGSCTSRDVKCEFPPSVEREADAQANGGKEASLEMVTNMRRPNTDRIVPDIEIEMGSSSSKNNNALDQFITLEEIISISAQPEIPEFINTPPENQYQTPECDGEITNPSSEGCSPGLKLINDPWSLAFYPNPTTIPPLTKHSMEFLFRVLRTWPSMMARELQLPSIIHPRHAEAPLLTPLAKCFTLCKMWYCESAVSGDIVQRTIMKEMQKIFKEYWSYNQETLLASLQALTIYMLMILFPSKSSPSDTLPYLDHQIFTSIQTLVYHFVGLSLILPSERTQTLPPYGAWLHIEATRRCVLTLYLIHWCYSIYHCLPSFACEELGFMPASAAKYLWQAPNQEDWEQKYGRWLKGWEGFGYLQGEFMGIGEGIAVDQRTERWLEEADEFGVMFMTIVNAAEREPYFYDNYYNSGRTTG